MRPIRRLLLDDLELDVDDRPALFPRMTQDSLLGVPLSAAAPIPPLRLALMRRMAASAAIIVACPVGPCSGQTAKPDDAPRETR